ncbi:hypothetical protein ES703_34319 [subsurface metagenome]
MVNQAQEKPGVTLVYFSLVASSGFISAIARSPKGFLASFLLPGYMLQDKRIFIDKLNKAIWELQILRNKIEEDARFPVDQANKAATSLYAIRAELKPLARELVDLYSQGLAWK